MKLAQVQSDLYIAHCTNKEYSKKPLGESQSWVSKFLFGGGLLIFVFTLIIAPMLLFSKLNPLAVNSFVKSGALSLAINYDSLEKTSNF